MKKWEMFSDEELEKIVKESNSYKEIATKIGYSEKGGGGASIVEQMVQLKGFDTGHFKKEIWNKGLFDYNRFQYGKVIKGTTVLNALIALRGHQCENCKLTKWQNQDITLEVHHIDGNRLNNILENLQLLCPNCHSLTDNYRGKKNTGKAIVSDEQLIEALKNSQTIRQALVSLGLAGRGGNYERVHALMDKYNISLQNNHKKYYCLDCGTEVNKDSKYCEKCRIKHTSKVQNKPDRETLKQMIRTSPFESIGKQYGINGNSVRKWCDKYNLPRTKKEINSYSDEEWSKI